MGITAIKTERTQIQFLSDVVALASLDLKVPVGRDSMEHTLYRSVWCSGSSLHCLCYRQCLCDISNGYLLTWWNRSDWWLTDLKVCSLRWCPLLLRWQKQDITMNIVYHSSSCKHKLLAKTNSPSISLIRRTLTAEHEVVGSNPDWTTTKPGLQKLLYGCIFLLCSCITLACFSIYFMGSRSSSTFWLSFHFPTWLQWNLSFGTSLFKRKFHSEDTKFHPRKLFTLSLYLLPLLKGHFIFIQGKGRLHSGFHLHSGDTLALKKWLTTKIIDTFKCKLLTMATSFITFTISLKSMYCTCGNFNTQHRRGELIIIFLCII